MGDCDIETYLMINEPVFDIGDRQYSVCCVNGVFGTWDSDGNTFEFKNISDLLDRWIVDGKPFRQIVDTMDIL